MRISRHISSGVVAGVIVLLGLGCGGDSPTEPTTKPTPSALSAVAGDAQTDTVGQRLPDSVAVKVADASGKGMAGVAVSWTVTTGGGSVAGGAITGADGIARAAWTLGSGVGVQSLVAAVNGVTAPRIFTATAVHDRAATIVSVPDSILLDAVGDSAKPVLTARDRFNNPVPSATFAFAGDPAIVTVGTSGFAKATGAGRAVVNVTADTARLALPVRVDPIVTTLSLVPRPSCFVALGDTARAVVTPKDRNAHPVVGATVTWASRDTGKVSVSAQGLLTARGNGQAWIVAQGATARAAKTDSVQVCVQQVVQRVELAPAADTINAIGFTTPLSATAYDARGTAVAGAAMTWTSLDATIATVSTAGVVTSRATGTARIVVASQAASDTVPVVVQQVASRVSISAAVDTVLVDGTRQYAATTTDSANVAIPAASLRWSSTNAAIVRVDSLTGMATAMAIGQGIVIASANGGPADSVVVVVRPRPCGDITYTMGASVNGEWTAGDCRDYNQAPTDRYVFTATAQEHFRATVSGMAGRHVRLRPQGSGQYVGIMPRNIAPETNPVSVDYLVQPGTYVIEVAAPDSLSRGSYTLTTARQTSISCAATTFATTGVQLTGTLASGDCLFNGALEDYLVVNTTSGTRLQATLTSTGFRPVIAIKDDRSLASPVVAREYRGVAGTVQASWTTRYHGTHAVIATSVGAGEVGSYTLRLDAIDASNTCVVNPYPLGAFTQAGWETTDCRTGDARAYDRYQVAGLTSAFRSNVAGAAGKGLEVLVDGVSVGRTRAWADTSQFRTHWFVKPGSLELRPTAPNAGGDSATMIYTLSSIADTNITQCRDVWMQRGATIPSQTLSATDCSFQSRSEDRVLIRLSAGETFTVAMTSAEFAPLLAFRDVAAAPGTVLAREILAAPGTARISWTTTVAGVYEIIFTSAATGVAGSYTPSFPSALASVTLSPDTLAMLAGDTARLSATMRDSANAVVTGPRLSWTSADTTVALVDSTGLVTARASGRAWVRAMAEGRMDSSLVQVAAPAVASVTITPASLALLAGDTATLKVTAMSAGADTVSGRTAAWTSADTAVATVSVAGLVTARVQGQVAIVATVDGVSDTATVSVSARPVGTLAISPDTLSIASRDSSRLAVAMTDDRGAAITGRAVAWTSTDTSIAVVSDSGWVLGRGEGTVFVKATSGSASDSSVVVVSPVRVARVVVSPDSSVTLIGGTRQLSAIAEAAAGDTLAGRTFAWVSLDTAIAAVDGSGLVTGGALGTARIVVSSGGKADTARVVVRSAFSRIAISPDTVTLTAVGQTQAYLATAYDTAGVAVSGVTFTWSIANPLVGTLDANVGQGATVTAEGAGVTQIFAAAGGMTGAASFRVGQYATTLNAAPDTVRLAVGGRATLSAEARDANGSVMPSATVIWRAANSFARVDSITGEVTAQTLGVGKIVARLYNPTDTVVSDTVQVVVANDAPPSLTFGANVFTVGRNAGVSIPIYLSTAPTAPVTLRLVSSDTAKGKFSAQYLTFSAGQTQQNAYFTATQVGTVTITATDTAGTYGTRSASVRINITATLTIDNGQRYTGWEGSSYYPTANQYDVLNAELRLSDPAPAGGLYFTISSGAHVSADPLTVFVPAGQLSTTFRVTAVGAGSGAITASAPGTTSASALMRVTAAKFVFADPNGIGRLRYTIGVGQLAHTSTGGYHVNMDAGVALRQRLPITFSISNPSAITAPDTMSMPAGQYRVIVPFRALAEGRSLLSATAPGWTSEVDTIIVTRPKVKLSNSSYGDSTYVGVQRGSMYATLADSADRFHPAADTVHFQFWSGDTTVVKVASGSGVILPGQFMPPGQYLYMQAVGGGTTYIYSGAPGYITDSIRIKVAVPKIVATGWNNRVTASASPGFVTDNSIFISLATPQQRSWVTFQSSDTLVAALDSVFFDPSGGGYPTVQVQADIRSRMAGTATVVVSAPNHSPDTIQVVTNTGRVRFSTQRPLPLQMFQAPASIQTTAYDSLGASSLWALDTTEIRVTVLDTTIVRMDSTVARILPGQHFGKPFPIVPVNVGTTKLILTAPNAPPDTLTVNVTGPELTLLGYGRMLATSQRTHPNTGAAISVTIPSARTVPVVVHLARRNPAISTLDADSITIPAGQTAANVGWTSGTTTGVDTVFATATGYAPDTLQLQVNAPRILPAYFYGEYRPTMPRTSLNVALGVVGNPNPVGTTTIPVTVYVRSSDPSVLAVDSAAIHFIPGDIYRAVPVRFVSPGTARLIFTDSAGRYAADSSNVATVVAPTLTFEGAGFGWKLGMKQQSPDSTSNWGTMTTGVFVSVQDTVRGAPLVIAISSSDPRVIGAPASVTIPVGGNRAFLRLVAGDTTGAIAVYATADGFIQGRRDVDVMRGVVAVEANAAPDLRYNASGALYVMLRDSSNTTENQTAEDLVLNVTSSNPAVVSVDSSTVTVPAGRQRMQWDNFLNYHAVGTATITLTDPRTGFVRYIAGSKIINVQDTTP